MPKFGQAYVETLDLTPASQRGGVLGTLGLARFAAHLRFTVPFGHCHAERRKRRGIYPP